MKKAYLAVSYQNRKKLSAEIESIKNALTPFQISLFVFVDQYHFTVEEEKQMMQQAFTEISSSELLIAEVSDKAIGVGIEIGYAAAQNKTIVYLRNTITEHSTTASGTAGYSVIYQNHEDLSKQLGSILEQLPI